MCAWFATRQAMSSTRAAEVRILAPGAKDVAARRNNESLVMKLVYRKTSALLEGDAENRSERQIAKEQPEADLLKAHRGSATSTCCSNEYIPDSL